MKQVLTTMLIILVLLSGCGTKAQSCKGCGREIAPEEHTAAANTYIQNCTNDDVLCEDCQLEYGGIIAGHCMRCLEAFEYGAPVYYGYEYEGDHFDIGICETCAIEVWGDNRESHRSSGECSVCGFSFNDARPEYENTGVCESCAAIVYR